LHQVFIAGAQIDLPPTEGPPRRRIGEYAGQEMPPTYLGNCAVLAGQPLQENMAEQA
jgi:hypothetical protein